MKFKMIKILELFGGIGACSKALERLGIDYEIADYVEIDKYAVKSFNAIHNTNFEPQDITTWDKDIEVDLIMHGSPCQDFSLAGKQAGGDKDSGTRSSLMYETIRIVEKLKPKYVVWENVKNLLSKKHIHNFNAYLETMEQLGYTNYYQVLNAKDYGIPQNRERVFTVSILNGGAYKFPKKVECDNEIKMINIPQMVKVRKYNVDVENLKKELKQNKCYTNKEIAFILDKPLTLVEHWFRNDNSFSIPDADVWFKLKALLKIKTNEFDDSITTFEEKQNVYEKSDRFYFDDGLAPTLTSSGCDEKIIQTFSFPIKQKLKLKLKDMLEDNVDEKYYLSDKMIKYISATGTANFKNPDCKINLDIARPLTTDQNKRAGTTNYLSDDLPSNYDLSIPIKNATKKGYQEAYEGDYVNLAYPDSKTRRGRVGKQIAQTLTTSDNIGVIVNDKPRKDIKELDKNCEYCGKQLERKRFNGRLEDFTVFSNRKYCNRECMKRDFLKIGEHDQSYSNAHTTARKINELILHKEMCELCGSDTNLDIHHIDGNWQNNNLDNLMCLCRSCHTKYERNKDNNELRIRKLTPLEVWRLMGFDDKDFEKASQVNSNTQLYKQAGNSIVVNVLMAIFKELIK